MNIKDNLKDLLKKAITNLGVDEDIDIVVEIPKNKTHGDYATNIAMVLSKKLKDNPMNIAEKLKNFLNDELIETITIMPPGFINFNLNKDYLFKNINTILEEKNNYGKTNIGNNTKINIEYVSANPTGTLHVGHARGATYGDSLSRILSFLNYDVTREYYINDAGNQMNNLGISIKVRYLNICNIKAKLPEDGYHGQEIIDIANKIYEQYGDQKQNEDVAFFKKYGLEILLKKIKQDIDTYRFNFVVW